MLDRTIFTVMLALGAGSVAAQGQDVAFKQLAEQCSQIRNATKDNFQGRAMARPLADQLEALAQSANDEDALLALIPVMNEEAADCIAYVRQVPGGVVFDPERNRYISSGPLRAEEEALRRIEENERAAVAEAEAVIQERLRQERQQALEGEVDSRVLESCKELAMSDSVAAYTNVLCVQSFKANGLPEQ